MSRLRALLSEAGRGRPRADDPMELVALRMPRNLLDRIDAHHEKLHRNNAGMKFSRSDVIRSLIHTHPELKDVPKQAEPKKWFEQPSQSFRLREVYEQLKAQREEHLEELTRKDAVPGIYHYYRKKHEGVQDHELDGIDPKDRSTDARYARGRDKFFGGNRSRAAALINRMDNKKYRKSDLQDVQFHPPSQKLVNAYWDDEDRNSKAFGRMGKRDVKQAKKYKPDLTLATSKGKLQAYLPGHESKKAKVTQDVYRNPLRLAPKHRA